MSYFGCGTRSNKIGWTLFGLFAVFGVVLMGLLIWQYGDCYEDYGECMDDLLLENKITKRQYTRYKRDRGDIYWDDDMGKTDNVFVNSCEDQLEECAETVLALFAAMVASYVAASIPLYMMCCCSNPPPHHEGQFHVVELPIQALTNRLVNMMSIRQRDNHPSDNRGKTSGQANNIQYGQSTREDYQETVVKV
eukprot:TRINITY_DN5879_c1_g1_i1.p3 TRINITY_DN5879_c1_g1~~TRINITY_DN5879_c1_g1_i1.p3  ORF type:complete len:193 (+),score=21.30 TRINITY_DN5879_c1_g1_i1:173-751(+)